MQKKDAELIYKNWTSDENVSKYVTWDTHKSVKDTKKYVHNAHYPPNHMPAEASDICSNNLKTSGHICVKINKSHLGFYFFEQKRTLLCKK